MNCYYYYLVVHVNLLSSLEIYHIFHHVRLFLCFFKVTNDAIRTEQFRELGIMSKPKTRRKTCCGCLDWSELRFHLGGEAGAAFFAHCEQKGWLTRIPGFREVTITASGKLAFKKLFGLNI